MSDDVTSVDLTAEDMDSPQVLSQCQTYRLLRRFEMVNAGYLACQIPTRMRVSTSRLLKLLCARTKAARIEYNDYYYYFHLIIRRVYEVARITLDDS